MTQHAASILLTSLALLACRDGEADETRRAQNDSSDTTGTQAQAEDTVTKVTPEDAGSASNDDILDDGVSGRTTSNGNASNVTSVSATSGGTTSSALHTNETIDLDAGVGADSGVATSQVDASQPADAALRSDALQCLYLPLECGDHLEHSTLDFGGLSQWNGYGSSQRWEGGKEVLYRLEAKQGCQVQAVLSDLHVDLDLFLLTACEPAQSIQPSVQASSTPLDLQDGERLDFTINTETTLIVVDGYDEDEGSYTLDVECDCP